MWHLLHDPGDSNAPFEMFHEAPPHSVCYPWFHPSDSSAANIYGNPDSEDPIPSMSVDQWCAEVVGGATYVLHSFDHQPTPAEVLSIIHSRPELLI